jgi:heat shock protein HslJ
MQSVTIHQLLRFVTVAAPITLLLCACVPITAVPAQEAPATHTAAVPASEDHGESLDGVTWQLSEYLGQDGASATPVGMATLTFQAGRVGGNAGCNTFSASYTLDGRQLTISQAVSTMKACPAALMAQEQAVLTNLGQVASHEVVENQLHLLNAQGARLLSFAPQAATTLTGVTWQATSYNNGRQAVVNVLASTEITTLFGEDGAVTGSAGCNTYRGVYSVTGDQIGIGPLAMTRKLCANPEGIMQQEMAYAQALATAATYTIQGDTLELHTSSGALAARYKAMSAADKPEGVGQPSGLLTGTVTYRQRITLPAGSVIEVQLRDVSKADVAAEVIASQTITTTGQNVPIPFTLVYDPAQIDSRYTYALGVRITINGQLRWINTERYAVLTRGAPMSEVEVVVQPAQ